MEEMCRMNPADVDFGLYVLHWLDAEAWEGDTGVKRLSLPSVLRRCGVNHIGCGHAKYKIKNIPKANCCIAVVQG